MVTIDGIDIRTYGACLIDGSYESLLGMPPLKEVEKNDWYEYDGIEVDLSSVSLQKREVNLCFLVSGGSPDAFVRALYEPDGIREFSFSDIALTVGLRVDTVNNVFISGDRLFTKVKVKCYQDRFDVSGDVPMPPLVTGLNEFRIDDVELATYGVTVLTGLKALEFPVPMKRGYTTMSKYSEGETYHGRAEARRKTRDVQFDLLMKYPTAEGFWERWRAFLHVLSSPGEHVIFHNDREYKFHYVSCTCKAVNSVYGLWAKMTLTVRLIDPLGKWV